MDLLNTTLIIPIKIEHPDRMRNARTTLGFINHHLKTNVFIYEISEDGNSKLDFLSELNNLKIKHWCVKEEGAFHRTKYLNIMLDEVDTPVVANYDIDIILRPDVYLYCQNKISNLEVEVVYPYERGKNGQFQVHQNFNYEGFRISGFSMDFFNSGEGLTLYEAECGHCVFFNTDIYRKFGGENENFISYGPEDKERMLRFQKLTKDRVEWIRNVKVYHFEHYRSPDSSGANPYFHGNWNILNSISEMNYDNLLSYYYNQPYREKYKKMKIATV